MTHALALLSCLGNLRARRMLGGYGVVADSHFVAPILGDVLYLKADALARPAFEAASHRPSPAASTWSAASPLRMIQTHQIKALETELGAVLVTRGTRKVEITAAGSALRQAVLPALDGIDRVVRQIRVSKGRRHVNLSTFASFITLWLMPRLAGFQQQHPDIDIRITATDVLADLDDPELDLVLRYDFAANLPPDAELLFGELLSPVASPFLTR